MRARWQVWSVFGLVGLLAAGAEGWAQTFSLDDDPAAPGSYAPAFPPLRSAEDRWGLGLSAGAVGASPSLGVFWLVDSDLLNPGLVPPLTFVPVWSIDGVSSNHQFWSDHSFQLKFSVDRVTSGVAGSAVANQFALNQQPGDIFISNNVFKNPCLNYRGTLTPVLGTFAGALPTAGIAGSNGLALNQSALGLLTGGVIVGPAVAAPAIGNGTHDNVDAYNDLPGPVDPEPDGLLNFPVYYSVAPVEAALNGLLPADLYFNPAGPPLPVFPPPVYAPAGTLGLDRFQGTRTDDIDALVVWDFPPVFPSPSPSGSGADPKIDCALFSLSPGSATLGTLQAGGWNVNPGTIFFTDFSGLFAVFAYSNDIGVRHPFNPRLTNVDGLEIRP